MVINFYITGATDPTAVATEVRNELLILQRRGAINPIFGGR